MGQYWKVVNLSKREFVDPHKLGAGLKLCEQLAAHPGTGAALIVLCAAQPEVRGGGDLDIVKNWHGPERTFPEHASSGPGLMPEGYPAIARRTIGRWAGDRIAIVGDYADDTDLPMLRIKGVWPVFPGRHNQWELRASKIYDSCVPGGSFVDISEEVCAVIEHELCGKFVGSGWRDFRYGDQGESGGR